MERVTEADRAPQEVAEGVYLADLAAGERTSMKFWRVEPGATLPTHHHHHEQIGYVISGALTALVSGEEHRLNPGDSYVFPSNELHGAENRGEEPAIGIGVLSPPREAPRWGTRPQRSEHLSAGSDD
ncbi:cupin domain-containing protein [Halegenticoccus tardaugens]|uniref:cupin domain-containing protein n=1 Tax=Halegenticoccus tardaugens TaxID=2071624 RepID=UPI00100B2DC7|nr:cupin domain-containing protein [Halegenticoccus tardaugens]